MLHPTSSSSKAPLTGVSTYLFLLLIPALVSFGNAATIPGDSRELHVLNRLAFGPRPGDIQRIRSMGVDQYIAEQLSPDSIPLPHTLTGRLDGLETLRMSSPQLFLDYGPPSYGLEKGDKTAAQRGRQRARVIVDQAIEARISRAVESPRQLHEVLVNFWFNHFNVFSQKGLDHLWVGSYEEQAIRPYALGRFRDLLGATAKHPAMLYYLDNWRSTAPNSPGARGPSKGLNENYARELMELHTLGVEGGYTQNDVVTLAKILTGWSYRPILTRVNSPDANGFFFDANRHDFSTKVFLGRTITSSGLGEGEEALDILSEHPATARFISYKLALYFVADDPPKILVDQLAKRFSETHGDIRAVLESLFRSAEFWDERYVGKKFKTPYEYIISAVRASGVPVNNTRPLRGAIALLGMPVYGCLTPDGYKNTQAAWLNPNAMNRRLSFATVLASGRLPLNQEPAKPTERMDGTPIRLDERQSNPTTRLDFKDLVSTLGDQLPEQTKAVIESSPPQMRAALVLGSPAFMHR